MDYAQALREERTKAHSIFHSVILGLPDFEESTVFAFFEGEDDPSFYLPHLRARCGGRECKSYICYGREEVLKVLTLIKADGRATQRSVFFIDKDHNDLVGTIVIHHQLFQTEFYSIENYLVDVELLSTYWAEMLHLDSTDIRISEYIAQFEQAYIQFTKRMRILMAIVLLGRGLGKHSPRKLNLNNVNFDHIFDIDFEKRIFRFKSGAGKHFAIATNAIEYQPPSAIIKQRTEIKSIIENHLQSRDCKEFIRGKYELWFFVKFLQKITAKLSSKAEAKLTGQKRATPRVSITHEVAIEMLAPRLRCPDSLAVFLDRCFSVHVEQEVDDFVLS